MVMTIIIILASLLLYAGSAVWQKTLRSRAAGEIQAMSAALEAYKTDNGVYPPVATLLTNTAANPYNSTAYDGSTATTNYIYSSQVLYMALSGQTNYQDTPAAGVKSYLAFRINEVGNNQTAGGTAPSITTGTYVRDPWNYSFAYSTGTTNGSLTPSYPYNGTGFFDLWSTGGHSVANVNTNAWISNWQ
jgi:type II secretory pathway pseudopilin PulG